MAKDVLGWAAEKPDWVRDSLRRIALAADSSVEQADADCILDNVRAAARAGSSVYPMISFDASHLGGGFGETRWTVLLQGHVPGVTVHGMRAAFRTWAREDAAAPDNVAEMVLAHTVGSKTVQAYNRAMLVHERRKLLEQWGMGASGELEIYSDPDRRTVELTAAQSKCIQATIRTASRPFGRLLFGW